MAMDGARSTFKDRMIVSAAVAVAFIVRLLPWGSVFRSGEILLSQPDGYYHLRRTSIILETFPKIPAIDSYMAFPFGAECPWPPLYDLLAAVLAWIVGFGSPDSRTVALVVAFLPVVLGALTVVPVFLLARRLAGASAALVASFFVIAVPGFLHYSVVGSGDHHVVETLLLATFIHLGFRSLEEGPSRLRHAVMSGVTLGAATLVWQGSVAFAVFYCGGFALWRFAKRDRERAEAVECYRSVLVGLLSAVLVVAFGRMLYPAGDPSLRFEFGHFSWFQPIFLLIGLTAMFAMAVLETRLLPSGGFSAARVAATALAIPIAALALFPSFRENVFAAFQFVTAQDPWLASIGEFQPSFDAAFLTAGFSVSRLVVDLPYLAGFLLAPVMATWELVSRRRRGKDGPGIWIYAFWTAFVALLALFEKRWANIYAINMAVSAGMASVRLIMWSRKSGAPSRLSGRIVLAWGVTVSLFAPCIVHTYNLVAAPAPALDADVLEALKWMRDGTPRTSGFARGDVRPEYAVLASWSYGHQVQSIGERPTIANNFGTQLPGGGIVDFLRFRYAPDEATMADICERRGGRYIFLASAEDLLTTNKELCRLIGIDFDRQFAKEIVTPDGRRSTTVNKAYIGLPLFRLYVNDGSASFHGPALGRFRLVYESAGSSSARLLAPGTRNAKIFEFVKGAVVTGRSPPGAEVAIACSFTTDSGRTFTYRAAARADERGIYSVRFPYSTEGRSYGVVPNGRATVGWGSVESSFSVSERDVLEGGTVTVGATMG